ncbi:MAG TPA: DEAD/DEAH box helicase [Aquella sp.]|nr:DEAD/DEAH box helicase [Aquella sp.]
MIVDKKYGMGDFELNPLQEMCWPHRESENNLLICGKTSSGKSQCAIILATKYLHNSDEDVVLYCGSYKSLCDEKWEDLTHEDHAWSKFKSTAITGDYFYDMAKLKDIAEARIILATPEMILSTATNINSERSSFIPRIKCVICDEIHEISNGDRGPNYENAIIELARENPSIQFIALSGTLPNSQDFVKWFSVLNGKETIYIESDYRPVELTHNFIPTKKDKTIADTELNIINQVVQLHKRPDKANQQFMNCVFKKTLGTKITNALVKEGIVSEFHNANATKPQRNKMEKAFKGGGIRSLTSTSTLFTGVNLPARNVIITWPVAGGGDIPAYVIQQAAGRAGRPKYDTEGDVYYLLPHNDFERHKERILKGENIMSNMGYKDVIQSHFIRAIYKGRLNLVTDFEKWYQLTLAYLQYKYTAVQCHELAVELTEELRKWGFLLNTADDNVLKISHRGRIAAQLLLEPRSFHALISNAYKYFSLNNANDLDLAKMFAQIPLYEADYLSFAEKGLINNLVRANVPDTHAKAVHVVYTQLTGQELDGLFFSTLWEIKDSTPRYGQGLLRAHNECEHWTEKNGLGNSVDAEERIRLAIIRVMKGMTWNQARLAVSKFSKSEIKALGDVGLLTEADVKANPMLAKSVLKPKRILELNI